MLRRIRIEWVMVAIILLFEAGAIVGTAVAQKPSQTAGDKLSLGEDDVKELLLLMDTNKNGKISKEEFMKFMEAEFERLDKDKSGELDPKELAHSKLRVSHPMRPR